MLASRIIKIFTLLTVAFPHLLIASEVDQHIAKMTLDQKVGQLFIVGFPQKTVDKRLADFIHKLKPGSYIFFKRNIQDLAQTKQLTATLNRLSLDASGVLPFVAVDQEGGVVSRLPIYPPTPNALALGQTRSPQLAEQYGYEIGRVLHSLGFNMNLAPVLDIADPLQPSMIGVRSLGSQPDLVGNIGYSISLGLSRAGIIPTAKHFPGMGTNILDPHFKVVSQDKTFDVLLNYDVKAFERFASLSDSSAVMLSHLIYPAIDASKSPAVFSKIIINDILRTRLGFNGVVMTDDLMMTGSSLYRDPEDGAVLALESGVDLVMLTWSFQEQAKAFQKVKAAIESQRLSLDEVHQKLRRILTAKMKVQKEYLGTSSRVLANKFITTDSMEALEQSVLDVNLVYQKEKLTVLQEARPLCVYASNNNFLVSLRSNISNKHSKFYVLHAETNSHHLEKSMKKNLCQKTLVAVHASKVAKLVNTLSSATKKNVVLLNLVSPSAISQPEAYAGVINLYFNHLRVGQKIAQYLKTPTRIPSNKTEPKKD